MAGHVYTACVTIHHLNTGVLRMNTLMKLRSETSLTGEFLPVEKLSFSTPNVSDPAIKDFHESIAEAIADGVYLPIPGDWTKEQYDAAVGFPFELNASDEDVTKQKAEMQAVTDEGTPVYHYVLSCTRYIESTGVKREGAARARLGRLGGHNSRRSIA